MLAGSAGVKKFANDLDSTDSRMANLVQTGLALGPALVPVLAGAAVGAVGLATALTGAAAGAGVAVLAFQGVGKALEALNEFQMDPTAASFEKMRQTMEQLGPEGQDFVRFLQDMRPEIQGLQDVAPAGLLPGVTEGLSEVMELLPEFEGVVSNISQALGDMAAQGGDALNDPFWRDFFDFVATDGRDAMVVMGETVGNLTEGLAGMMMAFDPLSDDFGEGLLGLAEGFAKWSRELDSSEGFRNFSDYIRDTGPQVMDTLGALANMLVQLTQAAAPVGAAVLPAITALADAFAAIADSPVGPVLIGAAAGLSAVSRAFALLRVANASALGSALSQIGDAGKKGLAIRGTAAAVGLLALSMTDLDESMGLTNTASFALLGSIAGPWGAAIGGGVGLMMDFANAGDAAAASQKAILAAGEGVVALLNQQSGAVTENARQFAISNLTSNGAFEAAERLGLSYTTVTKAALGNKDALASVTTEMDRLRNVSDLTQTGEETADFLADIEAVGVGIGSTAGKVIEFQGGVTEAKLVSAQLAAEHRSATNALDYYGQATIEVTGGLRAEAAAARDALNAHNALTDAVLAAVGGQIAFRNSVREAVAGSKEFTGSIFDQTAAADGQLTALIGVGGAWNALEPKVQNATGAYRNARAEFLRVAAAMGVGAEKAQRLADKWLDLPKNVSTKADADTADADRKIDQTKGKMGELDRSSANPRVDVDTSGANAAISAIAQRLSNIADEQVNIVTNYVQGSRNIGNTRLAGPNADGGLISGPGGPRDDLIPAMLSDGEFVVNAAATARNLALLHQMNAERFNVGGIAHMARGGLTPKERREAARQRSQEAAQEARDDAQTLRSGLAAFDVSGRRDSASDVRSAVNSLEQTLREVYGRDANWLKGIDRLGDRLVTLTARQDRMRGSLERMTDELQATRAQARQYAGGVSGSIDNDIFGGGVDQLSLQLRADANDNESMRRSLRRAREKGLSGGLFRELAASGDLNTARELSRLGRGRIDDLERQFGRRERAQRSLGDYAVFKVYGQRIADQTADVNRMSRNVQQMTRVIERQERTIEKMADRNERATERGARRGVGDRDRATRTRRKGRR